MKDNFDTTRRSVLLESDDRVDGTGKSLPETGDRDAGALTQTVGYLRMV